jgi:hypothetical protein
MMILRGEIRKGEGDEKTAITRQYKGKMESKMVNKC